SKRVDSDRACALISIVLPPHHPGAIAEDDRGPLLNVRRLADDRSVGRLREPAAFADPAQVDVRGPGPIVGPSDVGSMITVGTQPRRELIVAGTAHENSRVAPQGLSVLVDSLA